MGGAKIEGAWISELGKLIYVITQVDDRFVWRVIHNNGITETGIGTFPRAKEEDIATDVEACWNFDHGTKKEAVRHDNGKVILDAEDEKATRIEWDDGDHFRRLP